MAKRLAVVSIIVMVALMASAVSAREMQRVDKSITALSKHDEINFKIDIDAARIQMESHDGGELLDYKVRYDADKYDVEIEYADEGDIGEVSVVQEKRRRSLNYDSDDSRWTISMSRAFTYNMNLDIGFAECRADLSGVPISALRVDVGAAEGMISFDSPNPAKMSSFDIDAGAGEFDFIGLGYANAENYEFDGGAGEFTLDFTGFTDGFHTANIDIGVGEVTIELPEDLPVRIEADEGWFNEINIRHRDFEEVKDGVYETKDFDKGKFGLEIELDIGMGEATIRRADSRLHIRSNDHEYGIRAPRIHRWGEHSSIVVMPDVPRIPEIPAVPEIIAIPDIPAIASVPAAPAAPAIVAIPPIPAIPDIPAVPAIPAVPRLRPSGEYFILPYSGDEGTPAPGVSE
ncbi:MAG: toast rack family protein [Candidatus Zixiibacteriota bacterium]